MSDFDYDALIFGTKRCPACGREKAANSEQFARDAEARDGLSGECRECRNERERRRYRADPAASARRSQDYRARKAARA